MWEITLAGQTLTFLIALGIGVSLCLLYDVFRIIRIGWPPSAVSAFIEDIIYWFFSALITFCLLIVRCSGEIRGYVIFGELLGWIFCRFTVSVVLVKTADSIFKFLSFLKGLITTPIKATAKWIRKLARTLITPKLKKLGKFAHKTIKSIGNRAKKLLKQRRIMMYNHKSKLNQKKQVKKKQKAASKKPVLKK